MNPKDEIDAIIRADKADPRPDIDEHVQRIKSKFGATVTALNELLRGVDIESLTRAEQRKIIRETNAIINALNDEIPAEVENAVRDIYEHGRSRSLLAFGFFTDIDKARKFLNSRQSTDSRAHRAYLASNIEVMTSDLLKATQNTATQVKTTVRRVAGEVLRDKYRHQEGGVSTARALKSQLEKAGNVAIVDSIGRKWSLDFYAEVVATTKLSQAHREATEIEADEQGAGYFLVSRHMGTCKKCAPWETRVLRGHDGIEGDMPTIDEAMAQGLFHAHCKHNITPFRRLDRVPAWATY